MRRPIAITLLVIAVLLAGAAALFVRQVQSLTALEQHGPFGPTPDGG